MKLLNLFEQPNLKLITEHDKQKIYKQSKFNVVKQTSKKKTYITTNLLESYKPF